MEDSGFRGVPVRGAESAATAPVGGEDNPDTEPLGREFLGIPWLSRSLQRVMPAARIGTRSPRVAESDWRTSKDATKPRPRAPLRRLSLHPPLP